MNRFVVSILSIAFGLHAGAAKADTAASKTVAILELSAASPQDRELSQELTEAIYESASELKPEQYIVLAREHVARVLADKGIDPISCTQPCHLRAGSSIGADFVFGGTLRRTADSVKVVVELVEIDNGRLLAMKSMTNEDDKKLKEEFAAAIAQFVQKLSALNAIAAGQTAQVLAARPESKVGARVYFTSSPRGISVFVDNQRVCKKTPCSANVPLGGREIEMKAKYYYPKKEIVKIEAESRIDWKLEPYKYNYFGMNDLEDFGRLLTLGLWPTGEDYRAITVISGSEFANLNSVIDVGFGGDIFSFHRTVNGSHWGIFSFGPAVRIGRIVFESHLHLLSFRHKRVTPDDPTGWLPGVSNRVSIPLINNREWSGWAALVPVPAAGVDIWFDSNLNHDQTSFWFGFSWLAGFDFYR